jgi:putative ABC transport system permease protein
MLECFEDALDAGTGGRALSSWSIVGRTLLDLPMSACKAHFDSRRRRPRSQRQKQNTRTEAAALQGSPRFGRRAGPMHTMLQDLRYALRGLLRSPGLAALAILSLALGVGANTTMLGMVNSILWQELPAPSADRLVRLYQAQEGGYNRLSYANFEDIREQAGELFEDVLVHRINTFGLRADGASEVVYGELVSGSYFDTLGIRPATGHLFTAAESDRGAEPVVVISDHLWQRRFGRDPAVLGRSVLLNDQPYTIVGVAEPDFNGTKFALGMDLWVPAAIWARSDEWGEEWRTNRDYNSWLSLARLRPGIRLEAAEEALAPIAQNLVALDPEANRQLRLALFEEIDGAIDPRIAGIPRLVGAMAIAAASIVLLVACANVASLLYARALARQREIGIRFVLGSGRMRLLRQLLSESLLLALLGGALGTLVSLWTTRAYSAFLPALPYRFAIDTRPDSTVLVAAIALSLAAAFVAGVAPAWQASDANPMAAIRESAVATTASRRGRFSLDAVVVCMVALSFVSLVLTGLFVRSLDQVRNVNPGFATGGRLVASFDTGLAGPGASADGYVERLLDEVRTLPGVEGAAVSSLMPLGDRSSSTTLYANDRSYDEDAAGIETWRASVTADYFDVMGAPLHAGRAFGPFDRADSVPVAIVNQHLAERLWPGQNPLGRHLRFDRQPGGPTIEVIGVARDGKYNFLNEAQQPAFYRPFEQRPIAASVLVVEARQDAAALLPTIEKALESVDPRVPILDMRTVESHVSSSVWLFRMGARLAAALGFLALGLSAAGLFGVMTYTVNQRRRELGIRLALGARGRQLMEAVIGRGLRLTAIGVAIGLAVALAIGSVVSSLLFGVGARDPLTFAVVALALGAVAAIATLAPALSASRADPVEVLRDS